MVPRSEPRLLKQIRRPPRPLKLDLPELTFIFIVIGGSGSSATGRSDDVSPLCLDLPAGAVRVVELRVRDKIEVTS